MIERQPTILTLTQHGKTITISMETSDVDIHDMVDMVKGVLLASGWTEETLKEVFVYE
jgi:hypothetical protein